MSRQGQLHLSTGLLWLLRLDKHWGTAVRAPAGPKDAIPQMALSWHITRSRFAVLSPPHDAGPPGGELSPYAVGLLSLNAISAGLVRMWRRPHTGKLELRTRRGNVLVTPLLEGGSPSLPRCNLTAFEEPGPLLSAHTRIDPTDTDKKYFLVLHMQPEGVVWGKPGVPTHRNWGA